MLCQVTAYAIFMLASCLCQVAAYVKSDAEILTMLFDWAAYPDGSYDPTLAIDFVLKNLDCKETLWTHNQQPPRQQRPRKPNEEG